MSDFDDFEKQLQELLHFNGWEELILIERIETGFRLKLSPSHRTAPLDIINDYPVGSPLEQVQQECLRSLRTGRPGI